MASNYTSIILAVPHDVGDPLDCDWRENAKVAASPRPIIAFALRACCSTPTRKRASPDTKTPATQAAQKTVSPYPRGGDVLLALERESLWR